MSTEMTPTQIIEQAAEKYAAKHRTKGYGYSDNEQDLDNGFCAGAEFALSEPGLWREVLIGLCLNMGLSREASEREADFYIKLKTGK